MSVRASVVVDTADEKPAEGQEVPAAFKLVRARFRTVAYHLSTSALSRDTQPVFSLSYGWDGRERSVVTTQLAAQATSKGGR